MTLIEPAYAGGPGLAAVRRARPDRRRPVAPTDRGRAERRRRLLLAAHHPPDRPDAVRGGARAARRRRAAPPGARRRLPAGRRLAGRPRAAAADGSPGRCTSSATGAVLPEVLAAAEELRRRGRSRRTSSTSPRRPALPRLAAHPAPGVRTATTPRSPARCAPRFPERAPVVTVHDAASHAMAWLGRRSASLRPPRRRRIRPVGIGAELYELHDLLPGSHRQRRAGRAGPRLTGDQPALHGSRPPCPRLDVLVPRAAPLPPSPPFPPSSPASLSG